MIPPRVPSKAPTGSGRPFRFEYGVSGNPSARLKGGRYFSGLLRHLVANAISAQTGRPLLDELVIVVLEAACKGDWIAWGELADRVDGPVPIVIEGPKLHQQNLAKALKERGAEAPTVQSPSAA